jgi:hypothetical protein
MFPLLISPSCKISPVKTILYICGTEASTNGGGEMKQAHDCFCILSLLLHEEKCTSMLKRNELSYIQPSYASLNCNNLPLFLKLHLLLMMFAILLLLLLELLTPFIVKPPGSIWMYNHFYCVIACTNGKYWVAHEL